MARKKREDKKRRRQENEFKSAVTQVVRFHRVHVLSVAGDVQFGEPEPAGAVLCLGSLFLWWCSHAHGVVASRPTSLTPGWMLGSMVPASHQITNTQKIKKMNKKQLRAIKRTRIDPQTGAITLASPWE